MPRIQVVAIRWNAILNDFRRRGLTQAAAETSCVSVVRPVPVVRPGRRRSGLRRAGQADGAAETSCVPVVYARLHQQAAQLHQDTRL
jgi:hypothetical protein